MSLSNIEPIRLKIANLVSVHAGKVAPLGPEGVPSAFVKASIFSSVRVTTLGIVGDEQADLSVHGGPEKAVYGYSSANYALWREEYPQHTAILVPGGFGENFCIEGIRESDLCVGDVHQIGSSTLQVCQPRQPCFKLALRFADKKMPRAMIRSGRAGWYYRVLTPGYAAIGDSVHLEIRPNPEFAFSRLVELISHGKATREELIQMQSMPGLASDWRKLANDLLER